jgi:uroporphyrinogen decarboxylase
MRQAGRILPQYRKLRNNVSGFKELVKTPALAAEVTIQPVDALGVDAAIIFSDILVIPEAMGLPYKMIEKKGPHFPKVIEDEKSVDKLKVAEGDELNYVYRAIQQTIKGLEGRVPLIGFAGAPFTIFCYMVEGGGSKTFSKARKMIYQNPALAHRILEMITQSTIHYLQSQIKAGAHLIQVFDSWAGILSAEMYRKFAIPYLKKICDAIHPHIPVTLFSKDAHFSLKDLSELECDTIGIDWVMPPNYARHTVGPNKTLQGNLDPTVLYGDGKEIVSSTENMLASFGSQRHIANLGHGVYPDTSPEAVKLFIDTVKSYKHEQ